jgi:hypothetical protein
MSRTLEKIEHFRREELKTLICQCTEPQQHLFKQMYSHRNLDLPIDQVVDQMPSEKIDWAIQQCERTLAKSAKS